MDAHPDFADLTLPRDIQIGQFHLTPLSPEFVDEDLAAVLESAPLLDRIFGDWPNGLTRQDNLIDLAWHEREFTASRSFSWIIRDAEQAYLGCFYLYPALGSRGQAKAVFWMCDVADRTALARTLKSALTHWLALTLPPEIHLTWATRPNV